MRAGSHVTGLKLGRLYRRKTEPEVEYQLIKKSPSGNTYWGKEYKKGKATGRTVKGLKAGGLLEVPNLNLRDNFFDLFENFFEKSTSDEGFEELWEWSQYPECIHQQDKLYKKYGWIPQKFYEQYVEDQVRMEYNNTFNIRELLIRFAEEWGWDLDEIVSPHVFEVYIAKTFADIQSANYKLKTT